MIRPPKSAEKNVLRSAHIARWRSKWRTHPPRMEVLLHIGSLLLLIPFFKIVCQSVSAAVQAVPFFFPVSVPVKATEPCTAYNIIERAFHVCGYTESPRGVFSNKPVIDPL